MTGIEKFAAFTKKWEGGLSLDPHDSAANFPNPRAYQGKTGWHTNMGITYATWVQVFGTSADMAFYEMPADSWFKVFRTLYWDKVRANDLQFSIGVYVTGMAWGSGVQIAIKTLQAAINNLNGNKQLVVDGVIGQKTIQAANALDERALFDELLKLREAFFRSIAKPGTKNEKFLKGWLNRLEDYRKTFRP